MPEFLMPSLGADMEAGTLVQWKVAPGDAVKRGQVVAEVETAKGIIEIEIWQDGVVEALVAQPGETVPIGTVIARLAVPGREAGAAPAREMAEATRALAPGGDGPRDIVPGREAGAAPAREMVEATRALAPGGDGPREEPGSDVVPCCAWRAGQEREAREAQPPATTSEAGERIAASPAARRRARELGVDLTSVRGTGPHGVITHRDVEAAREEGAAPARERTAAARSVAPGGDSPLAGERPRPRVTTMREVIGAAMARSKREIPHYYLAEDVDMAPALAWLGAWNAARPVAQRVLPAALLLAATARAAREVPEMNGYFTDGAFRPADRVHLGVVLSLRGGGLVAPAIHDADRLSVSALMAALSDLILRARRGVLRSSELADGTITVTNLGDTGVERVFGVIYPPQVALAGFGRISERPWAKDGMLGVHPIVTATLAADHRVSDGHDGAAFLGALARLLADPAPWAEKEPT